MRSNHNKSEETTQIIVDLLKLIAKKNSIIKEKYSIDAISIGDLNLILDKYASDSSLTFTNFDDHNTYIRVNDRSNLAATIHSLVSSILGDDYTLTIEPLVFPTSISFASKEGKGEYYLVNYDCGTITA